MDDRGVTLVCLGRSAGEGVRVLQALHLMAPAWAQAPDSHHDWLVEALREASAQEQRRHRRLVLALPTDTCRSGILEAPVGQEPEALQAEVQLEAAQSLNVSTAEVSFDYEVAAPEVAETCRVHWLACLRSEVQAWQRHTRAAGWRLPAIEHQEQAARRAAEHVRGGVKTLLAQAHRDWQFSDPAQIDRQVNDGQVNDEQVLDGQGAASLDEALSALRGTPVWTWLCACGAGLRALS